MRSTETFAIRKHVAPHALARAFVALPVAAVVLIVTLPLWIVWLALGSVATLARALHRRLEPRPVPWDQVIEFTPELGWQARPNLDTAARADRVFRFTTDEHGWRRTRDFDDSDVVVFGDSFAFGWGIEDRDHFANVEVRTATPGHPVRIKAVGMVGYSLVHELIVMRRVRERLAGKTVVWLVYVGNDILANLNPHVGPYRAPYVRQKGSGEWEIMSDLVTPEPWPWPNWPSDEQDYAELCCEGVRSRRAYDACGYLLGEAKEICDSVGARLVVALVPNLSDFDRDKLALVAPDPASFDPERARREISAICARLDVGFVSLRDSLERRHYKISDLHWNEAGNRRVAEVLTAVAQDLQPTHNP